jgi:hypothetical protein
MLKTMFDVEKKFLILFVQAPSFSHFLPLRSDQSHRQHPRRPALLPTVSSSPAFSPLVDQSRLITPTILLQGKVIGVI